MSCDLCNASATFELSMEKVLQQLHLKICLIYLDYVIIFIKDFEEMLERLRQVFLLLRSSNLKLTSKNVLF